MEEGAVGADGRVNDNGGDSGGAVAATGIARWYRLAIRVATI